MDDTVRRLKANRLMAGKVCAACGRALAFGDAVAICTACDGMHDAACWDERGGCATAGCVSAPLERLAAPPPPPGLARGTPLPPGKIACPHCGKPMGARATICLRCKNAPTPDGEYRGRVTNAPGAVASMVCGLVGLLFFGIILGIVAIVKATSAKKLIDSDPRFGGRGFATAGLVLGIIDIAMFAIFLLFTLGSSGGR